MSSLEPGTCTLAIVMVQDFPDPASLPGGYKTGPPTDSSTYYNLWKVAGNLVERCVKGGQVGWQPTGMYEAESSRHSLSRLCFKPLALLLVHMSAHGSDKRSRLTYPSLFLNRKRRTLWHWSFHLVHGFSRGSSD